MKKIVVIGSSNTDMITQSDRLPVPGQIVGNGRFSMLPGGKGANQAVAVARMGGQVSFITKTGNDLFGRQSIELYRSEGILTDYVFSDPDLPSGMGLIMTDSLGEKYISIAPGAIKSLSTRDIDMAREEIGSAAILMIELEIPMDTAEYAAHIAAESGVKVILNPSPIQIISEKLMRRVDIIIPNKTEAGLLTGISITDWRSARQAAEMLHDTGIPTVVITLGAMGALILDRGSFHEIPAWQVESIDTTAVGDTFCGALCVGLAEGMTITRAAEMANKAASITVTRVGTQQAIPFRSELTGF